MRPEKRRTRSTEIQESLSHPVIDCDGHLREFTPQVLDYLEKVAGPNLRDEYVETYVKPRQNRKLKMTGDYAADGGPSLEERRYGRIRRPSWWGIPTKNPLDAASPFLPELLVDRMDELGMDYNIMYPTWGLVTGAIPVDEHRLAMTRAVNEMHADVYNSQWSHRLCVPAVIPTHKPGEAIAELDHCVGHLGFKAIKIPAMVSRPIQELYDKYPGIEEDQPDARWQDCYGLDSEYDYDPVWQKCMDLGVAVTSHGAAVNKWLWKNRSISNWTFNHMGNQPWQQEMLCKSLYMGGVTRRFPRLTFAFMEGGCFWGSFMLSDIIEHWEFRSVENVQSCNPANLDVEAMNALLLEFDKERFEGRLDKTVRAFPDESWAPAGGIPEDDFVHMQIEKKQDFAYLFENFFFGCEADDRMTAWAFDSKVNACGATLNAVLGSDIGHMDAPDFSKVVEDTYKLVEKEVLDSDQYADFMANNAIRLHGRMNPDFFKGTAVEDYAAKVLADDTDWHTRT